MTLPSWNLNQFYESIEDNQINKDFKNLNSISKKFQNKYRGKLDSLSSESLLNSLKEYEKVEEVIQKIQSFAYLSYCTDQLEDKIKKFYQEVEEKLSNIEKNLISNVKVFDVYEGDNIPENQKSIAINVTIQSLEKTLTDNDLEKINNLIIKTVENKTGAKIRS